MNAIRIVHHISTLALGGEQRYVIRLVNALPKERYDQTLVYTADDTLRPEVAPHVKCHMLVGRGLSARRPADALSALRFARDLRQLLRDQRAQIFTTHNPGFITIAGSMVAKSLGVPVVHTIQRPFGNRSATEAVVARTPALRGAVYAVTDKFVALGSYYQRDQIDNWLIPREKIVLNYIGIDLGAYRPDKEVGRAVRRELDIADRVPVLGIVARHSPEKGVDRGLRAFAAVRERLPDAVLLIVGDGPARSSLEALAATLRLGPAAKFLGGRADSARLINACDVVMQTTHNPLNGISSIETMASGKPVVTVIDRPEEREMAADTCEEGKNGLFFSMSQLGASADALAALLRDHDALGRMGSRSRELAVERFDLAAHISRLDALYQQLATGSFSTPRAATYRDDGIAARP